jgi:hypothetical protein
MDTELVPRRRRAYRPEPDRQSYSPNPKPPRREKQRAKHDGEAIRRRQEELRAEDARIEAIARAEIMHRLRFPKRYGVEKDELEKMLADVDAAVIRRKEELRGKR